MSGVHARTIAPLPSPANEGPFRVLYVRSLESRKGVDTLPRALARAKINDWLLEVIGDGPQRTAPKRLAAKWR